MALVLDRVYQGDCIAGMAKLAEGSVDLVFADPPFNIGYDYDVYDDRRAPEDYLAWSKRWIEGVKRVLKPTGTFWLAIGDEYAAELKVLCTKELGLHCRNWVIWFYTFGVHCKQKFTRSHAHLLYFVKNPKEFTFNSLAIRVPSARELVYADKRANPAGRTPDDTWMMAPVLPPEVPTREGFVLRPQDIPTRFPADSDTWYFSRVAGTFNERGGWHGCQMPEQLLGRIIRACCNEGEIVLDPFAGSGTTLAVAKKLSRNYLGFELSKEYAQNIEDRLAGIKPGDALIGFAEPVRSAPVTTGGRRLERTSAVPLDVSRSALVARANLSLGQVAVANGEYSTVVAEAFMAAHEGYSADRVLADPALNDRFLENCRVLGIPGEAKDWNRLLLNARKRGDLASIDTPRRTRVLRSTMAAFLFAGEMAWRKVSDDRKCSLDDILCDPTLAARFDRLARDIAPGFSSFEYRWAALSVRKDAKQGDGLIRRVTATLARGVSMSKKDKLPEGPGHYLITVSARPFFVGFSESLRGCPLFFPDRLEAALEAVGLNATGDRHIEIRRRNFDFDAIRRKASDGDPVQWKAAVRAKLLDQHTPIANILYSRPAA